MIEEPVTVSDPSPTKDTVTTHPAFAQIGVSRVTGNTNLYDSDFTHQHYMTISIRRSQLNRSLNRDWHYGGVELIEVALSEAQWATFVSAPNMGSGVPCTLQRHNGKMVPQLPPPNSRASQFDEEMQQKLSKLIAGMEGAVSSIDEMGLPKGKAEKIKALFANAAMELASNVPFIVSQFDEHMEGTTERAKAEIHGYMTSVLQRAGLAALTGPENLPLMIESHEP